MSNFKNTKNFIHDSVRKKDLKIEIRKIKKDASDEEINEIFKKLSNVVKNTYYTVTGQDRKKEDLIEDGVIEGEKFTVQGVSFLSVPSKLGANNAIKLYNTINGAGDKQPSHPKVKNSDMQKAGLELIKTHIYDKVRPGQGEKYIKRTGTPSESFWSSWYFGAAYNDDPDYHKVRSNGGVGYPAKKGYKVRQKVFANPEKYAGQTLYMTFHVKEAPVFPGDAIFHWRAEMAGSSFRQIGSGGPSHMKIMGLDGAFYGGNEPHSLGKPGEMKQNTAGSTAGRTTAYKLDSQRRLVHPNKGDYMAVFKKVKVLGREGSEVKTDPQDNKQTPGDDQNQPVNEFVSRIESISDKELNYLIRKII